MTINCGQSVFNFLQATPATQREWLAFRVHYFVLDDSARRDCDHLAELKHALCDSPHLDRIKATVNAVGALDHALTPCSPEPKDWLPDLAEIHDSPTIQLMALEAPLKAKHMVQIRQDWQQLRDTELSPTKVCEFERNLLGSG